MNLITLEKQKESTWGDLQYGLVIDEKINFLEQFSFLYHNHQFPVLNHYGLQENANWGDEIRGAKNVYLSVAVGDKAENVLYTFKGESNVTNVLSSVNITQNCTNIYNSKTVRASYQVFYSKYIYDSSNIWFSSNLVGCSECFFCNNLNNQSYYIYNVGYSKEEYFQKKREIIIVLNDFESTYIQVNEIAINKLCDNAIGNALYNCHDVVNAYILSNIDRARNILYCDGGSDSSDCYDVIDSATDRTHHLYGVMGQAFGDHIYCSGNILESNNIYYSFMLQNCSYCLGCTQLTNQSFCILNKQYTKEEWYEKVDEIFAQMDAEGTLGQFFPATMNPFYFNDTAAYLIDPSFTKEEVTAAGYLRRDKPIKVDIPEGAIVVSTKELRQYEGWMVGTKFFSLDVIAKEGNEGSNLSSWIASLRSQGQEPVRHINPEILKVIIQDDEGNVYKIVKMEYDFLMKHGLPLPRTHRLDRMKENFRIG